MRWRPPRTTGNSCWTGDPQYILYTVYIYIFTKGNLVRKLPSYGRLSWVAFPPSCQPHRHISYPSSSSSEAQQFGKGVNSPVKTLSGTKPCVFRVTWLVPVLASIWQSCRQKAPRTVARDLCFFNEFCVKSNSRYSLVPILPTSSSKSAPNMTVFVILKCKLQNRVCNRLQQNTLARLRAIKHE